MSAASRLGWWVLGGGLVVVGVLVAVLTYPEDPVFGWFAYTPLAEGSGDAMSSSISVAFDGGAFVGWWQVAGAGVAVVGLLVLVGRAAYLLGRRRTPA